MIIPEDGCLPQITRKGFMAFNNVMLLKVPEKLKKPGETSFQLTTLDSSKKGEKWPADQYLDIILTTPTPKETSSTDNLLNCNDLDIKETNVRKWGKFQPKKFKTYTEEFNGFPAKKQVVVNPIVSENTANFNHPFVPNAFHDSQVSHRRFRGNKHVQYNERTFDGDAHTYKFHSKNFSSDNQPYGELDNLHREGSSLNPLVNRYTTISREPTLGDSPYNGSFDFQRNPPPYSGTFVTNPQENNFNRAEISNPNFCEMGRNVDESFIQNVPNAYPANNYNEGPRNLHFNREIFPSFNSNRQEFMNNSFERPPYYHEPLGAGLNNSFNIGNKLPLLPPPFDNFNNDPFQTNFNERNPHYDQKAWKNHNQPNSHYHGRGGKERMHRPWRASGAPNKCSRGNRNRRANNRYQRKKS